MELPLPFLGMSFVYLPIWLLRLLSLTTPQQYSLYKAQNEHFKAGTVWGLHNYTMCTLDVHKSAQQGRLPAYQEFTIYIGTKGTPLLGNSNMEGKYTPLGPNHAS